jgi:hypothetical protein
MKVIKRDILRYRSKLSADITATVSTAIIWSSVTSMCLILGGPIGAPVTGATITTIVVWALRKMQC